MPVLVIFLFSVTVSLIDFGLIGLWYVWPRVRDLSLRDGLVPLLLIHCFRFLGLSYLVPGVVGTPFDPRFVDWTAYGDVLAMLMAFASIFALRANAGFAVPLLWIFNIYGLLDFIDAFGRAIPLIDPGNFGGSYFIPILAVPPMVISHFLMFARLKKGP